MSGTEELLPCPFCGEPANLCKQRFVSYDGSIHRCYWHVIHRCRHGNYTETKLCGTKAEDRAAWNRREDISATLGRGTCQMEYVERPTKSLLDAMGVYFCSECGSPTYNDCMPRYCIYCGAEVSA